MTDDERLLIKYIIQTAIIALCLMALVSVVYCFALTSQTKRMLDNIYDYDYTIEEVQNAN